MPDLQLDRTKDAGTLLICWHEFLNANRKRGKEL